ncbi:uncharacterized protein LOC144673714 [Cetorhinus maximus]
MARNQLERARIGGGKPNLLLLSRFVQGPGAGELGTPCATGRGEAGVPDEDSPAGVHSADPEEPPLTPEDHRASSAPVSSPLSEPGINADTSTSLSLSCLAWEDLSCAFPVVL